MAPPHVQAAQAAPPSQHHIPTTLGPRILPNRTQSRLEALRRPQPRVLRLPDPSDVRVPGQVTEDPGSPMGTPRQLREQILHNRKEFYHILSTWPLMTAQFFWNFMTLEELVDTTHPNLHLIRGIVAIYRHENTYINHLHHGHALLPGCHLHDPLAHAQGYLLLSVAFHMLGETQTAREWAALAMDDVKNLLMNRVSNDELDVALWAARDMAR